MADFDEQQSTQDDDNERHDELVVSDLEAGGEAEIAEPEDQNIDTMSPSELRATAYGAQEEAEKFRDAALRAEAEMQNLRRRTEREVEHAVKYGVEKLIQSLLPVVDSLEKAIESAEQSDADSEATLAIIEGMGLCQRLFIDVMAKEGVVVIDPHGEPFDPNLHQAISMIESPEVEPNSVIAVVQKGYQLNGRLVRPAMVMVAKNTPASSS
jgi:molecular chaperone GrpE